MFILRQESRLHFSAQFSPMWGSVRFTDIVNTHKSAHPSSAQPVLFRGTNIYYASALCWSLCLAFKISHLNVKTTLQMRDYYLHGSKGKQGSEVVDFLKDTQRVSQRTGAWLQSSSLPTTLHSSPQLPQWSGSSTKLWSWQNRPLSLLPTCVTQSQMSFPPEESTGMSCLEYFPGLSERSVLISLLLAPWLMISVFPLSPPSVLSTCCVNVNI